MLDIKALEKALTVIGNVGKGEFTFDVDGTPVTMRVLTADEDMVVQKYAREGGNTEDGEEDSGAMNLLERFKRMSLATSIVQIGTIDLRGEDFIATGEVTESGVPIRVSRVTAVRKIIDGWTRTATLALFQKYLEMVRRADAAAEKSVQFDTQDLDAEIGRVERRLTELKEEKAKSDSLRDGGGVIPMQAVGEADKAAADRMRMVSNAAGGHMPPASSRVLEPEESPEPAAPAASAVRAPVASQVAPVAPVVQAPVVHPGPPQQPRQRVGPTVATAPPQPLPPVRVPVQATPIEGTFESMQDSMGDSPEDIAAETARLVAARAQARRASLASIQDQSGEEPLDIPMGGRVPPHRGALNMGDAMLDGGAGDIQAVRAGSGAPAEAIRLPSAPVMGQAARGVQGGRPVINPEVKAGPNNPRFQGGRR